MSTSARIFLGLVSTAIAAAAFGFWLRSFHVSSSDVDLVLVRLNWWTVPVTCALLTAHIALSALRWARIEVALGGAPPDFGRAYVTGAWALGLGTFLPGPLATIACRGISNRFIGASGLRGAVGGGLDQVADIAIVALFAIPAAVALITNSPGVYAVGGTFAAWLGWVASKSLSRERPPRIVRRLSTRFPRISPAFTPGLLRKIYALSLIRLLNLTAITVMIHLATGAATFGATVVSVPLVTLAISAAMLPGSLGVSEWSFTGVFAGMGVPAGEITMFVLANRIILTAVGLAIGLFAAVATIGSFRAKREIRSSGLQLP